MWLVQAVHRVVPANGFVAREFELRCHLTGSVVHLVAAVGPHQGRSGNRAKNGNDAHRDEKLDDAVAPHLALGLDLFLHGLESSQVASTHFWTGKDAGRRPSLCVEAKLVCLYFPEK